MKKKVSFEGEEKVVLKHDTEVEIDKSKSKEVPLLAFYKDSINKKYSKHEVSRLVNKDASLNEYLQTIEISFVSSNSK
jgi:butyrate kinase